jgi:UDP-N-acetylmuramate dehydrogenase
MSAHTTFRIGGPADVFIRISTRAELSSALRSFRDEGIPVFTLGGGANILVGDKGIRGAVLDLSGLAGARRSGAGIIADTGMVADAGLFADADMIADAGISIDSLCENALALGLGGLENFYGMPGSLGGALYMNARCYEKDISEIVGGIIAISPQSEIREIHAMPSQWAYKKSPFQPGGGYEEWIIAGATLKLHEGEPAAIAGMMRSRKIDRTMKGHYLLPSAGSVFKNNRGFGKPTGAILDSLGMKGMRIGDAAVSSWHANIFVNLGSAKAGDMKALIETAMEKAFSAFGFRLEPEVLFVGEF